MIRERAIGQDRVNSRRIGAFLADLPFGFLVAVIAAVAAASVFAVLWWQASTATTTAGF